MPEINCDCTGEPICPYCGSEQHDAWELGGYNSGDGDRITTTCGVCEREFVTWRNVSITWSSDKVEDVTGESETKETR